MKFFNRSKPKKKERIMVRENRHKKREKKYKLNWGYFGLLFITWLLTSLIIYGIGMRSTRLTGIAVGQRATRSIVAAQDFVCENLNETDLLRSRAEKNTPSAFELSSKPWTDAERFLTHLETRLLQLRQSTPERVESSQSALKSLLDFIGIKLSVDQFSGLSDELKIQGSLMVLSQVSKEILTNPLVDQADKKERFSGVVNSSIAIYSKDKLIETVKLGNILTIESARHEFVFKSQKLIPNSVISKAVLTAIADRFITENLRYDQAKTAELKKEAFDKVEPIKEVVIAGTQIVEAHEIITPQILLQLRAHEAQLNESEPVTQKILRIFGGSILLLAALLATVGASKIITNDWQKKYREITLMVILSLITLLFSKLLVFWAARTGIIDPSSISFLLPQALAPLLVTILIGPRYGIICGIWVSIATGILFELSFGIFMLGFLVTIIGARMGCRVKNNSSVFRAEALVMLTKMLFVIIQGILLHPNIQVIFNQLAATGISVVVSTCFIILTIPLFETTFKFTSNIDFSSFLI